MQKRGIAFLRILKYKKIYAVFIALIVSILILFGGFSVLANERNSQTSIRNGGMDLTNWNYAADGLISLNDEWEFYWQKLLNYNDLHAGGLKPDLMIKVPDVWNNYRISGKSIPGFGYATYRLKVVNSKVGQTLAIRMPTVSTAYNLYINGKLIASNGKVGKDKQHFIPEYRPITAEFIPPSKDFDIILQDANFSYARGGAWYPIYMGSVASVAEYDKTIGYKDLFLIGAFLIMALYYFSIFFMRKEDKSNLYVVLLCLIAIGRTIIYGDYIINKIFPWIGYHVIVTIDYVTLAWFPVVFILLIGELFPEQTSKRLNRLFVIYAALISLFIILFPIHMYTSLTYPIEAVALAIAVYAVICVAKAFHKAKADSIIIFIGALAVALGGIHDVLYQNNIISSRFGELSSFGILILLYFQAFILARRFKESMDKARESELAFLQAQIKPHFLYNALNTFVSISRYDVDKARNLIIEFGNYLRGSFDFKDVSQLVPLKHELEIIRAYLEIEKARFEERIEVTFDLPEDIEVKIPILILQPIVENAVIHGILPKPEGGCIDICIQRNNKVLHIKVKDNGIGMAEGKCREVLKAEHKGGIGLFNIEKRLQSLYGRGLEIISKPGEGTEVNIYIPQK